MKIFAGCFIAWDVGIPYAIHIMPNSIFRACEACDYDTEIFHSYCDRLNFIHYKVLVCNASLQSRFEGGRDDKH